MRALWVTPFVAASLVALGCNAIFDIRGAELDTEAVGGSATGGSASGGSASGGSAAGGSGPGGSGSGGDAGAGGVGQGGTSWGTAEVIAQATAPTAVAIDGAHVYWHESGQLRRVSRGGGSTELVVSADATAMTLSTGHVYWATRGGNDLIVRRVAKEPPNGTVTNVCTLPWLAVANDMIESNGLYWANDDTGHNGIISISGTPGSSCNDVERNVANAGTSPQRLTVVGGRVYWTDASGAVLAADTSNNASMGDVHDTVATGQDAPLGIAADDDAVYWTHAGGVSRLAHTAYGNTPESLYRTADHRPTAMALVGTSLVWATEEGSIYLRETDETTVQTLHVASVGEVRHLALDEEAVFWTDTASGAISRIVSP